MLVVRTEGSRIWKRQKGKSKATKHNNNKQQKINHYYCYNHIPEWAFLQFVHALFTYGFLTEPLFLAVAAFFILCGVPGNCCCESGAPSALLVAVVAVVCGWICWRWPEIFSAVILFHVFLSSSGQSGVWYGIGFVCRFVFAAWPQTTQKKKIFFLNTTFRLPVYYPSSFSWPLLFEQWSRFTLSSSLWHPLFYPCKTKNNRTELLFKKREI